MIKVVKVGGGILDNPAHLTGLLTSIAQCSDPVVLVHGGGKIATSMASRLGLEQTMVGGRRVTDAETLQVVTMVYAGWVNKSIVAELHALGVHAIGVCGADADVIRAQRRPVVDVDYGYVGDVTHVNPTAILDLLHVGQDEHGGRGLGNTHGTCGTHGARHAGSANPLATHCLVIAPITHDGSGQLLNTNADTIATDVALSLMPAVELTYVFEHHGVLRDVSDTNSVIPALTWSQTEELVATGVIHSGMLPKLENAFRAVKAGLEHVRITRFDKVFSEEGTWISM
ncbi:MAG: acetylglutamate kinase [Bradyrhizobiaceae bacterium]|nr:acetylglutamate kinase [Bradyrhizobiaceae bacterium]